MSEELVRHHEERGIHTLTLDSPHNRNALSSQLLSELAHGLRDATTDPSTRAIVITGAGTVFCSGADLSERNKGVTTGMPEILSLITASPAPVIVRVNGHARAGGLGLIAAADMSVAPTKASFGFSEVRVGVAPAMIMVPALRVADRRFLTQMCLTGETFDAAAAAAAGLLTATVDDEVGLDQWVSDRILSILKSAPGAVKATKELLESLPGTPWDAALALAQTRSAELFASAEATEGMDAFLAKRTPAWDVTG
ncbi:MAG TPA: enoyl-CoA hydratase-related protein [Acidimicrobiales bacterium]